MAQIFYPSSENSPIHWSWVTLIGSDAQDFLHRVTTVNTKSMQIGQGASGCFLTPQGKIRVYFTLWHLNSGSYAFEFDAGTHLKWKTDLLSAIDQYTFSEKMNLAEPSDALECVWIFPDSPDSRTIAAPESLPLSQLNSDSMMVQVEEMRVLRHTLLDYGRTWLTAWGHPDRLRPWVKRILPQAKTLSYREIETWRVESLRPRVDSEITEATLPLEIGLRDAIAENKGCYPGQEVIEKIIALGSPSRRLVQMTGTGLAPQPGDLIYALTHPTTLVGQVTSMIHSHPEKNTEGTENFMALGLIKKMHAKVGLQVEFGSPTLPSNPENPTHKRTQGSIIQTI